MEPLTLGERIALLRRRHHLTQQQLATQLGVTQTQIHRLETGFITDPHISQVKSLAQALGVTTDWLVGLQDSADTNDRTPPAPPTKRPRPSKTAPVG